MKSWYDTLERQEALRTLAASVLGQPFFLNGRGPEVFGCAGLTHWLAFQLGAVPWMELPKLSPRFGGQVAARHLSDWMAGHPELFAETTGEPLAAGDLITGRVQAGEYHLGTYLGDWRGQAASFVHSIPRYGVSHGNLLDPTYAEKRIASWRIRHEEDRS